MGKKRCFLGFLASLFVFAFSANAQGAAGYTCTKVYDSCKANYYMDGTECEACPSGTGWQSTTSANNTSTACTCPNGYWNSTTHESTVKSGETCVVSAVTVTINKNGGTGSLEAITVSGDAPTVATNSGTSDVTITCTPGAVFRLGGISRVGYTLDGFSENQNATSGTEAIQCPSSTTTFYAIWDDCEAGHYCDEDGDHTCPAGYTSDKNSDDIHDCYRACTTGDIPHATSYTSDSRFYYGDTAPSQCKAADCEDGYTPRLDGTCVANTFTVTYDGNGNTGGTNPGSHTCTYGDTSCKAKANTFTKTNYEFVGWAAACDPMSPIVCSVNDNDVDVGDDISTITNDNGVTIVLKAKWAQKSGSGDCSCTAGAGAENCTASINSQDATKCDYSWSCRNKYWNSEQIATGQGTEFTATCNNCADPYTDGSDDPRDSEDSCYRLCSIEEVEHATAVSDSHVHPSDEEGETPACTPTACEDGYTPGDGYCESNYYTVVYNKNATTASGSMSDSERYYDDGEKLRKNAYTNGSNTFQGWALTSTGNVRYADEYRGNILRANGDPVENGGTITLYAIWGSCPACAGNTGVDCKVSVDANNNCVYTTTCIEGYGNIQGNGTANATCTPNTIQLTYNNGEHGIAPTSPSSCTYGESFNMPAAITADGYLFKKWSVNNKTFNAGASVVCNKENLGVDSGTATITATWDDCEAGHYCDEDGDHNCSDIGSGWTSNAGSDEKEDCYYNITLDKNGYSGTLNAGTIGNQRCAIATTATGTNEATLQLHWNSACTLPTINFTKEGWNNADKWSTSPYGYDTVTTIAAITTNTVPDTTTYYAFGDGCDDGYVAMGDSGECTACPEDFPYSDHDVGACYRDCGEGDIPNATSYTEDSKFYEYEEAPGHCVAESCESGYEGEDCHEASGITYKVCHYIKNVGASTYTLHDNACENKLGTSNAEITLANLKKTITGFTYDAGFAGISTHGTTKPSSGAVTTTTVLPDGSRVVDLYYNRNTYTLTLTKGTGIDSVTGAGTKEYGASVTIDATLTTNYTWSNWTNNNSNNAEVSRTKNYPFTMPANNLSYRANAVLGAIDCAAGKTASGTACPKGYYCPERTGVPASDSCEIKCPTDTLGGDTSTDGTGKISNTDCYTIRSCTPLKRAGSDTVVGYGDSKVYYTGSEYNGTPQITVTSCVAGYWLQFNTDPSCVEVGQAAWSPTPSPMCADENSLGKNLCSDLNGGNSDTTTDSNTSGSPTDCYNTCSVNNITVNGEVVGREVPAQEKVYYNGTTIPVCNYPDNKVECETGYERSGHTCVPKVFTITLNHNCENECTNTPASPIYLKYKTGWYANYAGGTVSNPITTVTVPTWPGNTFGGYVSGANVIIAPNGSLTTNYTLFTANATITASWGENESITCQPGTYYKGTGDTCTDCPAGSYCDKEINVIKDTGVPSGKEYCPAADSSNYTPAQTWNGTTLVDVAPGVNSPTKSEDISACYATVQYSADHGKGSQVCHYNKNDLKYNYDCADETILTCDGGYYRKNTTDTECSITESGGYYSVQYDINRTDCPLRNTESNIETLPETGAVSIDQCIQKGRWWTNASGHSAGTHFCYFNTDHPSEGYTANCKSYEIRVCDGGYYVEEEDIGQTFQTMPSCLEVGDGYYSPAQSQCTGEPAQPKDIHGCSMHRSACPATSAYAGTVASDIDSTKTNPSTGTRTATAITQCYLNCIVEKTNGTITQTVIDPTVEYNVSQSKYPRCEYESDEISCSAQTNGQYPLPASGVTDINQCYRNCTQADVGATAATWSGKVRYGNVNECEITKCNGGYYLENGRCIICPTGSYCGGIDQEDCPASHPYSDAGNGSIDWCYNNCTATPPATQMSGRDYYRATDTCVITKCQEGYYLEGGACVVCPAGSYCDTGGQHSCPSGYTSAAGSTKKTDCYQECNPYDIGDCHLTPVGGSKAYWPNECHYTATIDGNPAELVDGECVVTGCQRGYEMINGECEPCDRENALSYKSGDACAIESCVIGYHPNGDKCDPDILDCTPTVQDASYAEQKWISSIGQYDICIAKSCNEGFHLASNACVADVQDCEIDHGVGKKTWNPTTNKFGPCIATKCAPGYTSDPYLKNNASQQCSECRNKFSTLGEAAASAYFEGEEDCIIASCIYQGEKYNLDNNECVPICDQPYSDETGSLRWNNSTKKCERTCNPGYMSW